MTSKPFACFPQRPLSIADILWDDLYMIFVDTAKIANTILEGLHLSCFPWCNVADLNVFSWERIVRSVGRVVRVIRLVRIVKLYKALLCCKAFEKRSFLQLKICQAAYERLGKEGKKTNQQCGSLVFVAFPTSMQNDANRNIMKHRSSRVPTAQQKWLLDTCLCGVAFLRPGEETVIARLLDSVGVLVQKQRGPEKALPSFELYRH